MKSTINILWLFLTLVGLSIGILSTFYICPEILKRLILGNIDGFLDIIFFVVMLLFPLLILAGSLFSLLYFTRTVYLLDDVLYVSYWITPWMNYNIELSCFDSYCLTIEYDRRGRRYHTAYLCDGNEMFLYVQEMYCGNYDEMLDYVISKYNLPRKRFKNKLEAEEPILHLWKGGSVYNDLVIL